MPFIDLAGLDDATFKPVNGDGGHIRVIGLTQCKHCHHAIAVLRKRGVEFSFAYLDAMPAPVRGKLLRALKAHVSPAALLFPVLLTDDGTFVAGDDADVWAEAGVDTGGEVYADA